jgi:hypothetical protein
MEHVNEPVFVDDGRLFSLLFRQGDRHPQEVKVVKLLIGIVRAKTPTALLTWLGRLAGPFAVRILVNRFQPGRAAMVGREGHTLAEVRLE